MLEKYNNHCPLSGATQVKGILQVAPSPLAGELANVADWKSRPLCCAEKLLASEDVIAEDTPGIMDARLAGWRAASPEQSSPSPSSTTAGRGQHEPVCGDVVEYPLSDTAKQESGDGRERGVAVVVSVNKERNDAWQLPEEILDRAELQVLCPDLGEDGEGSGQENVWMVDELEPCAFAVLPELRKLDSEFNGALDKWKRWHIKESLSEGTGARDAEWEYDII